MNLKKLTELDLQKENRINSLKSDVVKLKDRVDTLRESLSTAVLTSDEKEVDKLVNELATIEAKIKITDETINHLMDKNVNAYTDEDVMDGFRGFAMEYEKNFYKLRSEYNKHLDEAFDCYKKMAELRRDAKQTRKEFANRIVNPPGSVNWIETNMPLSTISRGGIYKDKKEDIDFRAFYTNLQEAEFDGSAFNG